MCSRRLCASTLASTADAVVYLSCAPGPPHDVRACPGLGRSEARCILRCPCLRLDTCFWPRHTWTHHGECLVRTVCWKLCNPYVLTHTLCCELQGAHCLSASVQPSTAVRRPASVSAMSGCLPRPREGPLTPLMLARDVRAALMAHVVRITTERHDSWPCVRYRVKPPL